MLSSRTTFSTADGKVFIKEAERWRCYIEPQPHRLSCCGVTELNFQSLNAPKLVAGINLLPTAAFEELIACFIRASVQHSDRRIVLVGIPTKVGSGSMYNLSFYEHLRIVLHRFGFQEVCKPYKNESSSNTIVVLIAQMS